MTSRPKFDTLHPGPWPHDLRHGVGLHLIGRAQDRSLLYAVLTGFGCPPDIAHRLADDLQLHGERKTTVLPGLDFDQLAIDLGEIGVSVRIIAPQGYCAP